MIAYRIKLFLESNPSSYVKSTQPFRHGLTVITTVAVFTLKVRTRNPRSALFRWSTDDGPRLDRLKLPKSIFIFLYLTNNVLHFILSFGCFIFNCGCRKRPPPPHTQPPYPTVFRLLAPSSFSDSMIFTYGCHRNDLC